MSDYGRSSKKQDESSSHPKWGAALFLMALLAIGAYCYYHRDNPTSIKTPPPVASEPVEKSKEKQKDKSKQDKTSGNTTTLEEVLGAFLTKYKNLPLTCCAVKEMYQMIEAHPEWGIDTKNPNSPSNQALKAKLKPMVLKQWGAWKGWDLQSVCESFFENGAQCVAKTCPTLKASMQKSKKQCT